LSYRKKWWLESDPHTLYFALIGPGSNGKLRHSLSVYVPAKYKFVGVKAWSGKTDRGCVRFQETVSNLQSQVLPTGDDSCLVLRLVRRTRQPPHRDDPVHS
jgi:hypothetical protein